MAPGGDHAVILFGNLYHADRIAEAAGTIFNPKCDRVISVTSKDNRLLGGVTLANYTEASIQLHTAGIQPGWLSREFMWVVFDYCFNQLKVKKVFGQVRESNLRALEFDRKIGFKIVAEIEDVFPDGKCILHAMTKEQCRWLDYTPRSLMRKWSEPNG